jgi:hypoxanthine-guanine phosphoribosyltransferase
MKKNNEIKEKLIKTDTKHFALAYYARSSNHLKNELLRFKNNNLSSITKWNNILNNIDLETFSKVNYIVRALGSREEYSKKEIALDIVGKNFANILEAEYIPNILSKEITLQMKYLGQKFYRKQAIHNKYYCDISQIKKDNKDLVFLIIDDVSTTGATFDEIERVILEATDYEAKVYSFSLLKTLLDRDFDSQKQIHNQNFYKKLIA